RHSAERGPAPRGPGGIQRLRRARARRRRDPARARDRREAHRRRHFRHRGAQGRRRRQRVGAAARRGAHHGAHPRGARMSFKNDFSQTLPGNEKAPPRKIGNYEIMGVLGQGQSATIYLGRELFPAREVAIKVYDPHQFGDDTKLFRSLFLKETLLAKKLTHPGITQIYDAAADDDRAYIVMEYMPGGSLDSYCTPQTLLKP